MKIKIFAALFFVSMFVTSQEKYAKEISFVNDNDLYVSPNRDRYYTNGMFLSFRYLSKIKNKKFEKKIYEWQIGHEMYTAYKAVVENKSEHDRPFAAHLYASYGIKRVYQNNTIFNYSLQLGLIGPSALGKELQSFIHRIYGFKEAVGWQYQIKNALSFNANSSFIKTLGTSKTNLLDISWVNTASLGTIYTHVSSGFFARIGLSALQKINNSIAFNTQLNDENTTFKREIESFFFIQPMLRYAFYDATIEGSFLNKNSEVTKEIVPLVFDLAIGLKFTANRFNFGYTFNYNTSKSRDLRYTYGNKYGTLSFHYLLH